MAYLLKSRLLTLTLLAFLLVGCAEMGPTYTATPLPPPTATHTPAPTWTPLPPTATAGIFVPLPTSTPLPTQTFIPADALSNSGLAPIIYPPDVNPLTGLQVPDENILNRRPLVIKITNFPRSVRPQWGLSVADHVYEYYLEDGMTRFIGVFYGQDAGRVGPVRSARPFDEQVVRMYKGAFIFGYADDRLMDPLLESDLKKLLVIETKSNCPPLCRIGPENAYNTLYADTQALTPYISARGVSNERQNLNTFRFDENTLDIFGGGKADIVKIRYSNTSHHYWEYDPISERFRRWQESSNRSIGDEVYQPLFDSLTAEPVSADNLVILKVPTSYYFKSNSTNIYNFALKYRGEGYALRNGKIFKIQWRRDKPKDLVSILYPNGVRFPFKPGNIWFEVLTQATTHSVDGSTWNFLFDLNLPD